MNGPVSGPEWTRMLIKYGHILVPSYLYSWGVSLLTALGVERFSEYLTF